MAAWHRPRTDAQRASDVAALEGLVSWVARVEAESAESPDVGGLVDALLDSIDRGEAERATEGCHEYRRIREAATYGELPSLFPPRRASAPVAVVPKEPDVMVMRRRPGDGDALALAPVGSYYHPEADVPHSRTGKGWRPMRYLEAKQWYGERG
jgi:hypothetical protein